MDNSKYSALLFVYCIFFIEASQAYDIPKHPKTWYEAPDVGWSWYKDTSVADSPIKQQQNNKEQNNKDQQSYSKNSATSESDSQGSYTHTKQMERVRLDFEELQAKAILNPTLENVREFQKAYHGIVNRSTSFEKAWMMSSLLSAENYRESDQSSPAHRKIYQEQEDKQLEEGHFCARKNLWDLLRL